MYGGAFLMPALIPVSTTTWMLIEGFVFVLCVILSALFSGSETALTSMTKIRVKRIFSEGEAAYKRLEPWLHDPNRFLATILVGNNFVNILASVLAADLSQEWLRQYNISNIVVYGSAVAVAFTTFILLLFGEILPKTFSKERAVKISQAVIGPLDTLYRILRPLIRFFLFFSNTIIRLFGGHAVKELPLLTEEDVIALIEMSEREGVLERDERDMIASIIDFGDRTVKEIMTPRVDFEAIAIDTPMTIVLEESVRSGRSRIPVYENDLDHIVGILYVKDLLAIDRNDPSITLQSIVRPVLFIPNTKKFNDLLTTFRREKTHIALVVDEYGTTDGLVTIEDVLEEIVGDIQDEYDSEPPDYEIQPDGSIIADAKINLDDLEDLLHVEFPDEDVETLGGFINSLMGTVPKVGEEVDFNDLHFTILESDERKICKVKILQTGDKCVPLEPIKEINSVEPSP